MLYMPPPEPPMPAMAGVTLYKSLNADISSKYSPPSPPFPAVLKLIVVFVMEFMVPLLNIPPHYLRFHHFPGLELILENHLRWVGLVD